MGSSCFCDSRRYPLAPLVLGPSTEQPVAVMPGAVTRGTEGDCRPVARPLPQPAFASVVCLRAAEVRTRPAAWEPANEL